MHEKHYDYYITSKEVKESKLKEYDDLVGDKRQKLIKRFCDEVGAIAYTTRKDWGGATYICELVFEVDHDIVANAAQFKKRAVTYEGKACFAVTGKGNRKEGIAFNRAIKGINKELEGLPMFTDWLIMSFGVMRTGYGESLDRGTALLSTSGGVAGDRLAFRIPNSDDKRHGDIEIPQCFEKVTYGLWYDLVEGDQG